MPLIKPTSTLTPPKTLETPLVTPAPPQTQSSLFESAQAKDLRITEIEGEPLITTYYNRYIRSNEVSTPLDKFADPSLQQYTKIEQMRLSVTEDLSYSFSQESQSNNLTGSALIYPNTVVPTTSDMFVCYVEGDRRGVFTVTETEPLSYFRLKAYRISYTLHAELTDKIQEDLDAKTIRKLHFDVRRLNAGYAPLITETQLNGETDLRSTVQQLIGQIYSKFYDKRTKTFVFKNEGGLRTYDTYAVEAFKAIIGKDVLNNYKMPKSYSAGPERPLNDPTLWNLLVGEKTYTISTINRYRDDLSSSTMDIVNIYYTIGHTDIAKVVTSVAEENDLYILSNAFYTSNVPLMSKFERLVYDSITAKTVKTSNITEVVTESYSKVDRELFYRLIILTLICVMKLRSAT